MAQTVFSETEGNHSERMTKCGGEEEEEGGGAGGETVGLPRSSDEAMRLNVSVRNGAAGSHLAGHHCSGE